MEFHVTMSEWSSDVSDIETAIREIDPSAQVDLDSSGRTLRVAAAVGASELVQLINGAGHPVTLQQVAQVPSTCCGGCSG